MPVRDDMHARSRRLALRTGRRVAGDPARAPLVGLLRAAAAARSAALLLAEDDPVRVAALAGVRAIEAAVLARPGAGRVDVDGA